MLSRTSSPNGVHTRSGGKPAVPTRRRSRSTAASAGDPGHEYSPSGQFFAYEQVFSTAQLNDRYTGMVRSTPRTKAACPTCWRSSSTTLSSRTASVTGGSHDSSTTLDRSRARRPSR